MHAARLFPGQVFLRISDEIAWALWQSYCWLGHRWYFNRILINNINLHKLLFNLLSLIVIYVRSLSSIPVSFDKFSVVFKVIQISLHHGLSDTALSLVKGWYHNNRL